MKEELSFPQEPCRKIIDSAILLKPFLIIKTSSCSTEAKYSALSNVPEFKSLDFEFQSSLGQALFFITLPARKTSILWQWRTAQTRVQIPAGAFLIT